MIVNKLFEINSTIKDTNTPYGSMVSKFRTNREYLISSGIAKDLNTYVSFAPFPTFNDLFAPEYDDKGNEITNQNPKKGSGTPGVRSIFNKVGAVVLGDGSIGKTTQDIISKKASNYRISNNVPLMDNRETRLAIKEDSGCTVNDLVQKSQKGLMGRNIYSYSDFMYCKYLGRMSNNYMVTLRRFPYPVDDYISTLGTGTDRSNKDYTTRNTDSMGCLVTWMGTPGNELPNILKYTVTMPFKEQTAQMEQAGVDADSGGGIANGIAAAFSPTYQQQYMASQAGTAFNNVVKQFFPNSIRPLGEPHYPASQWNSFRDSTKVYGPVDAIKKIYMRGEDGLDFQQSITLTFDYELRSYNGINGRQAMLDLLSNVLNVTYSTGTFWGGGYRGGGAHQNNIFTNLNIFKAQPRGFAGYIDAFAKDYSTISKSIGLEIAKNTDKNKGETTGDGILNTLKKLANNLGGMLLAGTLNNLGRPQKAMANSLLSPAPVGFWHVTIGNPNHPIMSMGNMILKSATINHYGPLGLDDFPIGLKVVCELTRGKSRDIRDIEKLYMKGNDRIYTSMGPKVFDMYTYAYEYQSQGGKAEKFEPKNDGNQDTELSGTTAYEIDLSEKKSMADLLKKYFGHSNTQSIMIAAMEQENGAHKRKKKGAAGGDSSVQGNKK